MSKYNKAFEQDVFRPKELFVELFNELPDFHQYYNETLQLDTTFLTKEKCEELFGENIDVRIISYDRRYTTSQEDYKEWDGSTNSYKRTDYPSLWIIDYNKHLIMQIDYNSITCNYKNCDVREIIDFIVNTVPSQPVIPKTASIDLVAYDNSYYTINSKIKRTVIDLDSHYNDDFQKVYKDLLEFLNEQESGLAILRGKMGSGKSYFIRNLLSTTDKKYILVTNAIASHMAEPEFIAFMMEHRDSIFILEDCEQILMAREENRFGGAVANILNMSDGLMSDIFNIKFICTFNTDIENIDEALLRPGRCFVNYEFKELCEEKTRNLLKSLGHEVENPGELTLAQIYNYSPDEKLQTKRKIGF